MPGKALHFGIIGIAERTILENHEMAAMEANRGVAILRFALVSETGFNGCCRLVNLAAIGACGCHWSSDSGMGS